MANIMLLSIRVAELLFVVDVLVFRPDVITDIAERSKPVERPRAAAANA